MSGEERADPESDPAHTDDAAEDEACRATAGREARYADVDTSHLDGVEDGCGCAEVWEHTSDVRPEEAGDDEEAGADAD